MAKEYLLVEVNTKMSKRGTGDYIYDAIFTDEARSIILELRYKEHYFRPILSSVSLTSEEIE